MKKDKMDNNEIDFKLDIGETTPDTETQIKQAQDKLTDDEFKFCEEYLKCLSLSVAISKVYPYEENTKKRGKALITSSNVKQYLNLRRQAIRDVYVTREDVLLRTLDLYDKCIQPIPVVDKRGHPTGEYTMDTKGATKILELLYKHLGLISPEGSAQGVTQGNIPDITLTEEELDRFKSHFESEF